MWQAALPAFSLTLSVRLASNPHLGLTFIHLTGSVYITARKHLRQLAERKEVTFFSGIRKDGHRRATVFQRRPSDVMLLNVKSV